MREIRWMTVLGALLLVAPLAHAQNMDLNAAPASDLATLDGVSEELARSIVREREENGPFSSVDDLMRVPGVTPELVAKLKTRAVAGGGGSPAKGKTHDDEVKRVLKKFNGEPTISQVQEAAVSYARVNPDIIDSWRIRSKAAAALPQFRAQAGYDFERNYRWLSSTPQAPFPPVPQASSSQPRTDELKNKPGAQATATWNLDRLLYSPAEPAINRESIRLSKHRDQVVDDVTRRYFERRRLQVELELNPPQDVGDRIRKEIRLQELTADIDGLTGGYFSAHLKSKGR